MGTGSSASAPPAPSIQYAYDASDNRTRVVRGGVADTYSQGDPGDRLLWTNTAAATAPTPGQTLAYSTYVYDEWGQLIQRDRRATKLGTREVLDFRWDSAGRLREVKKAGATVFSARYAADGERVQKTDPASGSHQQPSTSSIASTRCGCGSWG